MLANLSVEQYLMKAKSHAKKGELDEAQKIFEAVLITFPKNIRAQRGLASLNKNNSTQSPSQEEVNQLVNLYNKGQIETAIKQAEALTKQYPGAVVVWNILGTSRAQIGKLDEAIEAYKKTISLKPDYAKAYSNMGIVLRNQGKFAEAIQAYKKSISIKSNNAVNYINVGTIFKDQGKLDKAIKAFNKALLIEPDKHISYINMGNALKDQGKYDEAIESYKKCISLKPDYADAYNNMGVTFKHQGKLDEAIKVFKKTVLLKPYHTNAYHNMANTLRDQGKLGESVIACKKALSLKPDYSEAYSNLANTFHEMGKLDEAEANYVQAIALKPNFSEALYNLSINRSYMNNLEAEIHAWKSVLQIDTDDYGLRAGVHLAIHKFLEGDLKESKKKVLAAEKIHEKTLSKYSSEKVYQSYLFKILKWHEDKYCDVNKEKIDKTLYVIGESHCLTSHHLLIQRLEVNYFCKAKLIKGCKQWHLGNSFRNQYKNQFERIFRSVPKNSDVLLAIGEIDCRLDGGIIEHKNKFPKKNLKEIILYTVQNYLTYIINNNSKYSHNIVIQGVPCPNINIKKYAKKDIIQLIEVIKTFNCELEAKSKETGFSFLDVHKLTDKGDGLSNNFWHMDITHLSPDGMIEAWQRYNFN